MRVVNNIIIFLLLFSNSHAQNLVPNPSFEQFNTCPNGFMGIAYSPQYNNFPTVTDWVNPSGFSTSDYLNACAPAGGFASMNVPQNTMGFQHARTGNGYAGIIPLSFISQTQQNTFWLEYIECKLIQPLVAGTQYKVSFYVSFTFDSAYYWGTNVIATDKIGAYLSNTMLEDPTAQYFSVQPQVESPAGVMLSDTVLWVEISGIITAQGGEQWLTIGKFIQNPALVDFVHISPTVPDPFAAEEGYMYIDDVSVIPYTGCDTVIANHDTVICDFQTGSVELAAAPGQFHLWSTGLTSPTIIVTTPGTFWSATIDGCDVLADTFTIRLPGEETTSRDTIVCFEQSVTITSRNGSRHIWNTGDTTTTINVNSAGVYWCKTLSDCTIFIDTIDIIPQNEVIISKKDSGICSTEPLLIQLHPMQTAETYLWSTGDTTASIFVNNAGTYWRSARTGCITSLDTIGLHIIKEPVLPDLGRDTVICEGDGVTIGGPVAGVLAYEWNTGAKDCCIVPEYPGQYVLRAIHECGVLKDSVIVDMENCVDCFFVPNAFTPNNDGVNDEFSVVEKCDLKWFQLNVYDRWGELVFHSLNKKEKWDGKYKGQFMPVGTYFYYIVYTSLNGKQQLQKGDVTLIR